EHIKISSRLLAGRGTKRKLSEPMAIGFNSPRAFGGGNWRKIKWQTQKNWWSNSATCRCWRLLDWSISLRKNGGSAPPRRYQSRLRPPQQAHLAERQLP